MATATARKVAASGFGSTPAGRDAVVRGPKPAADPPARRPAAVKTVRSTAPTSPSGPSKPGPARKTTAPKSGGPKASGRGPDYRAPKLKGPLSKNRKAIRLGSVRAQHMLLGELMLCLVVTVLDDVMGSGDLTGLPVKSTALAGLFLLLALISTGGKGAERVAVAFGGLVTLGVVLKRWGLFPAIRDSSTLAYMKAYPRRPGAVPGSTADPGPPITAPAVLTGQRSVGNLVATP